MDELATRGSLATDAQITQHFDMHLDGDGEEWITLVGDISDEEFSVQIPNYANFQIVSIFALGLIAGILFGWLSSWGNNS